MRLQLFVLSLLTISCWSKSRKPRHQTGVDTNITAITHATADTLFQNEHYIILGDSSKPAKEAIQYAATRFRSDVSFDDCKTDTLRKFFKAPIQYGSNSLARQFKTVITRTYQHKGLNFGGFYCFVEWGCGSPCQTSAVVDLRTGIVYDGVDAALGYQYKKNSRLLIVNPPDSSGFYLDCAYCEPIVYVWNEYSKQFEKKS